ncbi:hypothetical protein BUALT_Bualt13G0080500 [Buddleja alternifolia]|uniref:RBR-type E3 ubiquitin transferase n=1 Tax=Buddleja alternifolia TaxID=168488 RepID=A0AAV6WKX9_9LAMI|nr:hypothetical protein BUALT_Bualt13G0080500 [Buddleja alternifolia]
MSIPTPSFDLEFDSDADEPHTIAAAQRRELMAAKALDSDLDFAFNIQLQEALTASLSLNSQPSTSSSSVVVIPPLQPQDDVVVSNFTDLQSDELLKLEQELKDQIISETEFKRLKDDLHRRIHDHRLALEISRMPEEEWEDWGDNFERPFGEGSSKGVNDEIFRVYFKGLVEKQLEKGIVLGGIGVAICDSRDELLFELRKPLVGNGISRQSTEIKALIEGLNAALELELKRVVFFCDYYPIFKFVTGQWSAKQRKVSALVNQVSHLREKFTYCRPSFVPRYDIKLAIKLAREAIVSQGTKAAGPSGSNTSFETCVICLEDTNTGQIFTIDDCMHRYCFSCMKQHVEVKLLHGMLPTCPHEGCKTDLKIDSCSKFLTPRLIEIMRQRIKEASIPLTEKVYCPYPKCSALMTRREVLEHSKGAFVGAERSGARKCIKCNGRFCIDCKVPWHNNMTCFDYKRTNPYPQAEEAKLKNLAATNLWRQCVKCNHMIELAAGCYHMTCRCGYEFCYTCGAEWKNKKASCSCPLWDEQNILEDEFDDDDVEEEEEDEEEEEYQDYDSDSDDNW